MTSKRQVKVSGSTRRQTGRFPLSVLGGVPQQVQQRLRQLRAIPHNGIGFGALRYLGSPAVRDRLRGTSAGPQVAFNYLGQWDARPAQARGGLCEAVRGSLGQDHDLADQGPHLLEVLGAVQAGRLEFSWHYLPGVHDRATIAAVAGDFADALRRIARDCKETA